MEGMQEREDCGCRPGLHKVSVIVPVYNSAAYMDFCLRSLVCQTYPNTEIILVDDGSTDDTLQRCMSWKRDYPHITVLSKAHEGQGPARSHGMKHAAGDYIAFVDSDDWVAENYIEAMLNTALQNDCELVVCNLLKVWLDDDRKIVQSRRLNMKVRETRRVEASEHLEYLYYFTSFLWNKLYKRTLLDRVQIEQPADCVEDMCVSLIYAYYAEGIIYLPETLYFYWQRQGSSSYQEALFFKAENTFEVFWSCVEKYMPEERESYVVRKIMADLVKYYRLSCAGLMAEETLTENAEALKEKFYCVFGRKEEDAGDLNGVVFGSFNLRCMVNELAYFPPPYYGFSSLAGLMNQGNKNQVKLQHANPFRQKMLEAEQRGTFWEEAEGREVLFLDFMEERYGLVSFGDGTYVTDSDAFEEADKERDACFEKIKAGTEEYLRLWERACGQFIRKLRGAGIKKTVLVRNRLMDSFGEFSGEKKFGNVAWIERCNQQISYMEEYFMAHFPETAAVQVPREISYTDVHYAHGCFPWHMNETAYAEMAKEIRDSWSRNQWK